MQSNYSVNNTSWNMKENKLWTLEVNAFTYIHSLVDNLWLILAVMIFKRCF